MCVLWILCDRHISEFYMVSRYPCPEVLRPQVTTRDARDTRGRAVADTRGARAETRELARTSAIHARRAHDTRVSARQTRDLRDLRG